MILINPILEEFIFTFFILSLEFLERRVSTIKKALELMSPGITYSKDLNCFSPMTSILSIFFYLSLLVANSNFSKIIQYDFLIFLQI